MSETHVAATNHALHVAFSFSTVLSVANELLHRPLNWVHFKNKLCELNWKQHVKQLLLWRGDIRLADHPIVAKILLKYRYIIVSVRITLLASFNKRGVNERQDPNSNDWLLSGCKNSQIIY